MGLQLISAEMLCCQKFLVHWFLGAKNSGSSHSECGKPLSTPPPLLEALAANTYHHCHVTVAQLHRFITNLRRGANKETKTCGYIGLELKTLGHS